MQGREETKHDKIATRDGDIAARLENLERIRAFKAHLKLGRRVPSKGAGTLRAIVKNTFIEAVTTNDSLQRSASESDVAIPRSCSEDAMFSPHALSSNEISDSNSDRRREAASGVPLDEWQSFVTGRTSDVSDTSSIYTSSVYIASVGAVAARVQSGSSDSQKTALPASEALPTDGSLTEDGHCVWGLPEVSGSSSNGSLPRSMLNGDEKRHKNRVDLTGITFIDNTSSGSEAASPFPSEAAFPSASSAAQPHRAQPHRVHPDRDPGGNIEAAMANSVPAKRHPALAAINSSRMIAGSASSGSAPADQALWSKGSILHTQGKCKPCAWSWKPGGCSEGADCLFCHTCTAEDHKQYKKDRLASLKASREQKRR
jgi:hypothetical protein